MRRLAVILLAMWLESGSALAQGYFCRTSPVDTSTSNCASEAFVTNSQGFVPVLAFGALPSCGGSNKGQIVFITNSNTSTFNATISGTGSNLGLAVCNGTNWTFH